MGSSPPKGPDPIKTAGAQTGMNVGTAVANQMMGYGTQSTPYGTQTISAGPMRSWTDPVSGKTYQLPGTNTTQTLSPAQKALQDAQTRAGTNTATLAADQSARLGGILGKPMNFSGAPQVGMPDMHLAGHAGTPELQTGFDSAGPINRRFGAAGDITKTYGDAGGYEQGRKAVEEALFARLNQQLERDQERLRTQLANQGLKQGTEAYAEGMDQFGRQSNDARYGAILGAGEEQSRLAGLDQNRAQFENSAQQQAYDQALGRGQFSLGAQQQRFGQSAARAAFGNDATQQMFGNRMDALGFNNDVRQSAFANERALRGDWMNEAYANRNQPIQEISALLGTGGVMQPNFAPQQGGGVANTDFAGIKNAAYQQKLQGYQAKQNQMGGLFGMFGSLGSAGIGAI
jgi:hypothetical protein